MAVSVEVVLQLFLKHGGTLELVCRLRLAGDRVIQEGPVLLVQEKNPETL